MEGRKNGESILMKLDPFVEIKDTPKSLWIGFGSPISVIGLFEQGGFLYLTVETSTAETANKLIDDMEEKLISDQGVS